MKINLSILSKIHDELNLFNLNEIRLLGFKAKENIIAFNNIENNFLNKKKKLNNN